METLPLAPDAFTGQRLGKYELACQLSKGGMSEIFLAFQRGAAGFRKYVVLKKILPFMKDEEEFVRMFVEEAKTTALFSHPNIAQVYDLDQEDGDFFLVMEFVPGASLEELQAACVQRGQRLPVGLSLAAAHDVALALHYAHHFTDPAGRPRPVIHRDVALKNVMVTWDGAVKLLDFGIARRIDQRQQTQAGLVKGTSGYMSPEQIRGEPLDPRSDIFSLGVVLHECLTGERLFSRRRLEDELNATLSAPIPGTSSKNPEVPPALDAVVTRALARDRAARHATARELAKAIDRAAGELRWEPEQIAELVKGLFAERREQTRALLAASYGTLDSDGPASTVSDRGAPSGPPAASAATLVEDETPRETAAAARTFDETRREGKKVTVEAPAVKVPPSGPRPPTSGSGPRAPVPSESLGDVPTTREKSAAGPTTGVVRPVTGVPMRGARPPDMRGTWLMVGGAVFLIAAIAALLLFK